MTDRPQYGRNPAPQGGNGAAAQQSAGLPARPIAPPPITAQPPDPDPDRWTIGRLLTWTTDYLKSKHVESPRLDAEVLLAHVLECSRVQLYTRYEESPSDLERSRFRDLIRQRAAGAPVAYMVQRKEFYALPLRVTPAVLIPRPDTEVLVAEFLTRFKNQENPLILDLGTGSGAIALASARQHATARVVATDVSPEALLVASGNANALGLADRVEFRQGPIYEPIRPDERFDAILTNPPYIPTAEIATLEAGVRDYEPHLALDGGVDGLRVIAAIVAGAPGRLAPGGMILIEIGSAQEESVRQLLDQQAELELGPTVRDAANHPRVLFARRKTD